MNLNHPLPNNMTIATEDWTQSVERAAFEAALDENRHDWQLRLVYADWLEERGDIELATAQRWMATHQRAPARMAAGHTWGGPNDGPSHWHEGVWDSDYMGPPVVGSPHVLRRDQFHQVTGYLTGRYWGMSRVEAEGRLATAIAVRPELFGSPFYPAFNPLP